ncbi:MAG TPA: hypothetical protein VHI13_11990 [Candidatus Kapabacteria bacterium]|nr:hypothetical protein [Candidatus Kapabacteria bacterium]
MSTFNDDSFPHPGAPWRSPRMRPPAHVVYAFLLTILCGVPLAAQEYPAGIVYGPKAAFQVAAPDGWVLSNTAGLAQSLHCVLYLQGSTWVDSPVIMYAKIASPTFTRHETFARWAVAEYRKEDTAFQFMRVGTGHTGDGHSYIVNEYRSGGDSTVERVAYIQLPKAVAYIVLSARNNAAYASQQGALAGVLESFRYTPRYIRRSVVRGQ